MGSVNPAENTLLLKKIYQALRRAHGPRGWWPVLRPGAGPEDRPVYDPKRKRLTARQRFEVAVGAILTQNTAWANVSKALVNLHRAAMLSGEGLRRIPRGRLARMIRPSGYFNQKAKKLKAFLAFLDDWKSGGRELEGLLREPLGVAREKLLEVNGIGPETADSILLYALDKPIFVVDAYTRRIFSRHGWIRGDEPYDDVRLWFEKNLPAGAPLFNDYHAQIVETGKRYCHRVRPDCPACPLYRRSFFKTIRSWKKLKIGRAFLHS
ncbi:endonuclease III domain-containing protein [bacterium]|nr:endonuclease III domain-containing protein [bacterium]